MLLLLKDRFLQARPSDDFDTNFSLTNRPRTLLQKVRSVCSGFLLVSIFDGSVGTCDMRSENDNVQKVGGKG